MKNLIILIAFTFIIISSKAATITLVTNNGDWQTNSTWDLNRLPASGDNVIIPIGKTVKIGANVNLAAATLTINIYGTLNFTGSHRIQLGALSMIYVYSGGLISNVGGVNDFIQIGGSTVWDQTDGNVVGPKYATVATGSFVSFVPLPVIFASFTVTATSSDILIEWATAQEQNAAYFDVERSENGSKWTSIIHISAKGNSSILTKYSYTDKNINADHLYYRIKQVDIDGQYYYTVIKMTSGLNGTSGVIKISSSNHSVLLLFPNQEKGNVIVRIVSFGGQIIREQNLENPVGQIILPVSSSIHGNYIVSLNNGQHITTAKQVQL